MSIFGGSRWLFAGVFAFLLAPGSAPVAQAAFVSPFPSTVEGISIPNTHLLAGDLAPKASAVIRGMEPREGLRELLDHGVTDFVIFKTETKTEVRDQMRELLRMGFEDRDKDGRPDRVHHYPFRWRGFGDKEFTETCEMTLDALKVMFDVLDRPGRKVFVHCTVGEDRTGALAGLFRMLSDEAARLEDRQWSVRSAFYYEMCENGYSAGNPQKATGDAFVAREIDRAITPFYVKMGFLIEQGLLIRDNLRDKSICRRDPKFDSELRDEFRTNDRYNHFRYRCRTSSRYPGGL